MDKGNEKRVLLQYQEAEGKVAIRMTNDKDAQDI